MKKILKAIVGVAVLFFTVSTLSACHNRIPGVDNKTHNQLEIHCDYRNESVKLTLPVKHKRRDYGGSYAKIKTTSGKSALFNKWKEEAAFIEEQGDTILFLVKGENGNHSQYVAATYEDVNADNSKYYDYTVSQQYACFNQGKKQVEFSFPICYLNGTEYVNSFLLFDATDNSQRLNYSFAQLKAYYERLDYAFVSATENCIIINGTAKDFNSTDKSYKDEQIKLEYESGTVTASLAE